MPMTVLTHQNLNYYYSDAIFQTHWCIVLSYDVKCHWWFCIPLYLKHLPNILLPSQHTQTFMLKSTSAVSHLFSYRQELLKALSNVSLPGWQNKMYCQPPEHFDNWLLFFNVSFNHHFYTNSTAEVLSTASKTYLLLYFYVQAETQYLEMGK